MDFLYDIGREHLIRIIFRSVWGDCGILECGKHLRERDRVSHNSMSATIDEGFEDTLYGA